MQRWPTKQKISEPPNTTPKGAKEEDNQNGSSTEKTARGLDFGASWCERSRCGPARPQLRPGRREGQRCSRRKWRLHGFLGVPWRGISATTAGKQKISSRTSSWRSMRTWRRRKPPWSGHHGNGRWRLWAGEHGITVPQEITEWNPQETKAKVR